MPDSKLSQKDFDRWRVRLKHARDVWTEKGIIGNSQMSAMRILLEMYRGNHWGLVKPLLGLSTGELVTINKVFSGANTLQAQVAARDPEVQVFPRSDRAVMSAPKAAKLVNYDIEELNFMRQWNASLRDHFFAPIGICRHGFTPDDAYIGKNGKLLELYRPAKRNRPWIKRIPMWDCLLDPLASSWHNDGELRWVAFRNLMTEEQIENTPGMVVKKGLAPNVSQAYKHMRDPGLLDERNEDWGDLIEIYSVYEIWERTWFQMTLDDEVSGPVREQADWPLPWEHLPVDILAVNEQMDSPFPVPVMEEAIPIQLELNRLRTIMSIIARNTRRIIAAQKGGMDEDELDKLEDSEVLEILEVNGVASEVIQEIRAGGFPQELIPYNELLERDFRETIGQSQMDRAQRINVETAQEAAQVQVGSDIHTLRNQQAFEKFITSSVRNYMHGRRAVTMEEELIPVVGPGAEDFVRVSPEDLSEDLDYKIVVGSTRPDSHQQKSAEALADIQVVSTQLGMQICNVAKPYEDYFVARGKNPREYLSQQKAQQAEQQIANPMQESPEGMKIDPAALAIFSQGGRPQ